MKTFNSKYLKVGDKVTCDVYGKGEVNKIHNDNSFLIIVLFESTCMVGYNTYGAFERSARPTLHNGHVEVTIEVSEPCQYHVGELIAVRDDESSLWFVVQFYDFKDGKVRTNKIQPTSWNFHCKLSEAKY